MDSCITDSRYMKTAGPADNIARRCNALLIHEWCE